MKVEPEACSPGVAPRPTSDSRGMVRTHSSSIYHHMTTAQPPKKRGGPRPGAGRPPGALSKRTQKKVEALAVQKMFEAQHDGGKLDLSATPLDVMLLAMHKAYELGGPIAAMPFAKEAAPYCHAKITSMDLTGKAPTVNPDGSVTEPAPSAGVRVVVEFVKPPSGGNPNA